MSKRMIDTNLWNNEQIIESFTAEDKYFWLYLLTSPHNSICGVMKASQTLIARDMGYSKETISNLLARFEDIHKLIVIDKNSNELIILNWYKFNWSKSDRLLTAVKDNLKSIKSEKIKDLVVERLELLGYGIDRVSIGYAYPSNTNTITNTNNNIYNIENNNITNKEEREINKEKENIIKESFDLVWSKHPRKVNKQLAIKSWNKKFKNIKDIALIEEKIEKIKELYKVSYMDWKKRNTELEYIPHFSSWLNANIPD